jgi:hypothetical protein
MLVPRHGIGAAVVGDLVIIPGGSTVQGFGVSDANTIYRAGAEDLPAFRRGDVYPDERLDLADAVRLVIHLFVRPASLECADAADVDDDGQISIGDAVSLLSFLFLMAPPPAPPHPAPGGDPSPDFLSCEQEH